MGRFAVAFCWVFTLLLMSMAARADAGSWLYDVDVPVADQSAGARGNAFEQALLVVLERVSGLDDVPKNGTVAAALASPQRYYVEYRYREVDNPASGALPAKVLTLAVRFAPNAIQKLIADADLPLWSSNRPTTLAWVAVDDGAARTVLGANGPSALATSIQVAIQARARERGLPLVLPKLDGDEQLEVTPDVMARGMSPALEEASQRYTPDQILVGRLSHTSNDSWVGDWQLAEHADEQHFHFVSSSVEAAAASIVDTLVDRLVARYAVTGETQQRLRLRIEGITDVSQYGALMQYLDGLEYIDAVQIEEVRLDAVMLSLTTHTSWDRLRDLLALDGRLAPAEGFEAPTERRVLHWQGDSPR